MILLLSSDWQTQTTSLKLSELALQEEERIIKKYKVDIHIDTGDSKEEYSPVAVGVVNLQVHRSRRLAKLLGRENCFRLLGNHDRIGQHSDERNWLTIFDELCTCVVEPAIYGRGKVKLCFLPFSKDVATTLAGASYLAKNTSSKSLLFFHCEVKGARFSSVRSACVDSEITGDTLYHTRYIRCFGGHIHKRQTLLQNIHYVGNPFPTDAGEVNQEKGFTLYDTDTDKITFIPSGLPCIYTYEYLLKKGIKKVPDGTQIKHSVPVKSSDDYYEVLQKSNAEILKAYPNALPYVHPDFIDGLKTIDEDAQIDIDATELEQIKGYLDLIGKDDKFRAPIEAYMRYVLSAVLKKAGYAQGFIFDKVKAHNILSFKDVSFSYRRKGVCLIRGENKDWPGHSNGAGKSNLLGLLPVAHSGKTFKNQKFGDIVNDYLPDEKAWIELSGETASNDKLVIYRQFNPSKLRFTVNGKDASQGMRSSGKKDTQGLIEEYTGYTFDTLANAVYIDQSISQSFLYGTEKERAELLHKFQNLDRFTVAYKMANTHYSLMRNLMLETDNSYQVQEVLLEETRQRIAELKTIEHAHVAKLKKEYLSTKKQYEKYLKVAVPAIENLKEKIESLKQLKKQIRLDNAHADLAMAKSRVTLVSGWLDDISKVQGMKKCKLCSRPLNHSAIKKREKVLKKDLASLIGKKKTAEQHLHQLEQRHSSLEETIEEKRVLIDIKQSKISKLKAAVRATKESYMDDRDSVSKDSIEVLKKKLLSIKVKIQNLLKLRKDQAETCEVITQASKAFGRDGLPLFLNNLIAPRLNAAAKYYSDLFVDNELQILFVVENSKLVPKVVNAHGGKKLTGQSLGEKGWAGIITAFAVRDIAQPTNILILDEPGAGLDPQSCKQLGKRLAKLSEKYETLLVVTHNPYLESALIGSNTVTVVKKHGISRCST